MLGKAGWYTSGGLALIVAGLSLFSYIQGLRIDKYKAKYEERGQLITKMNDQLSLAKDVNDANAKMLELLREQYSQLDGISKRYAEDAAKRDKSLKRTLEDIYRAPSTDDGPIAPVLRRQLDRMRNAVPRPAPDGGANANRNPSGPTS